MGTHAAQLASGVSQSANMAVASAQHKPLTCSTACAIPSVTTLLISSFSSGLAFYYFFYLNKKFKQNKCSVHKILKT